MLVVCATLSATTALGLSGVPLDRAHGTVASPPSGASRTSTTKTYDEVCDTDGQIAFQPGLTKTPHRQAVTFTAEILAGPGCPSGPGT
jgi:hypothetical protein